MKYRVVECEYKETSFVVEDGTVFEGPIEDVLVVVLPSKQMRALVDIEYLGKLVESVTATIEDFGYKGQVMFVPDMMKFARFEKVDEEEGKKDAAQGGS